MHKDFPTHARLDHFNSGFLSLFVVTFQVVHLKILQGPLHLFFETLWNVQLRRECPCVLRETLPRTRVLDGFGMDGNGTYVN